MQELTAYMNWQTIWYNRDGIYLLITEIMSFHLSSSTSFCVPIDPCPLHPQLQCNRLWKPWKLESLWANLSSAVRTLLILNTVDYISCYTPIINTNWVGRNWTLQLYITSAHRWIAEDKYKTPKRITHQSNRCSPSLNKNWISIMPASHANLEQSPYVENRISQSYLLLE